MTPKSGSLLDIASADLDELVRALTAGELSVPLTRAGLAASGLAARDSDWTGLLALGISDRQIILGLVRSVLAERTRAGPKVQLVWTGPEATASRARKTAAVVRELFESATSSVLVAGYTFDHGSEILAPLHEVMTSRHVRATFFLNVAEERMLSSSHATPDEVATRAAKYFFQRNWPFPGTRPTLYYAPHTFSREDPASLHAKCIVVDEERTLIGSANFTDRGHTRNIEVGVAVTDGRFAREVVEHFQSAMLEGVFRPCLGA